jgi:hypothetical protein
MEHKTVNSRIASILCGSLVMLYSSALCQKDTLQEVDASVTSLAATVGINDFHQMDKYLSPCVFGGTNFATKLSFQVQTEQSTHTAEIFFSDGALNSDIQPRYVREHLASLSYSYARSLCTTDLRGHPLQFLLGGGISSFFSYTDFNTTDETHYTTYDQAWYWSHSLNIVLSGRYEFDPEKSLTVRLTVPVAGLVSRPENERWLSQANLDVTHDFYKAITQGKMEYLWNSFVLFTEIEYRHALSNDFDLLATYRFAYVSTSKPASILAMGMYMNNLTLGIGVVL